MLNRKIQYDDLIYSAILLVAVALPLPIKFNNITIGLLVTLWLVGLIKRNITFRIKHSLPLLILCLAYYLLNIVGAFYSELASDSRKELETKIHLVIFPLIFYTIPYLSHQRTKILLFTFISTNLFVCLYCLLVILAREDFLVNGFSRLHPYDFINRNFTSAIELHPLYLSCYINLSIIACLWLMLDKVRSIFFRPAVIIPVIVLLMFFNMLVLSRMGLLIMLLILVLALGYLAFEKLFLKTAVALLCFTLLSLIVFYNFNYTFKARVDTTFSKNGDDGSLSQRMEIWHSSLSLYKKNWAFGVGTGDLKNELTREYELNGYKGEYYNCHNEYLQTGNSVGILGIALILAALGTPFLIEKKINIVYTGLLFMLALSFFTESMLSVQKGVLFYSFFNSLFGFGYAEKNYEEGTM